MTPALSSGLPLVRAATTKTSAAMPSCTKVFLPPSVKPPPLDVAFNPMATVNDPMLSELGTTLEARKDLQREIRTMLSGAVFTSYLVMIMGIGTIVLVNVISPGVLREMTTTVAGIAALAVSGALYAVAYVLIRQITRVDA